MDGLVIRDLTSERHQGHDTTTGELVELRTRQNLRSGEGGLHGFDADRADVLVVYANVETRLGLDAVEFANREGNEALGRIDDHDAGLDGFWTKFDLNGVSLFFEERVARIGRLVAGRSDGPVIKLNVFQI